MGPLNRVEVHPLPNESMLNLRVARAASGARRSGGGAMKLRYAVPALSSHTRARQPACPGAGPPRRRIGRRPVAAAHTAARHTAAGRGGARMAATAARRSPPLGRTAVRGCRRRALRSSRPGYAPRGSVAQQRHPRAGSGYGYGYNSGRGHYNGGHGYYNGGHGYYTAARYYRPLRLPTVLLLLPVLLALLLLVLARSLVELRLGLQLALATGAATTRAPATRWVPTRPMESQR